MTRDRDIKTLIDDFAFLDDWEDRYRYVIELGKELTPLESAERNAQTKVQGCVSQVWLVCEVREAGPDTAPTLFFRGDSDAHIVRGLIAILLILYSGQAPDTILATDAGDLFRRLGLDQHLSPQRSNGLHAMINRIRSDAGAFLTPGPA